MKVRHASSLVTLIIVLHALPVAAQDYPAKPVRLIVNTAAGGLMDVAARVTADHLGKALGQRFIIENRPGSGGNIGTDAVAKAEPDGYTLGQIQLGNVAINPHIYPNMPFDPFLDIAPVAPLSSSAILIVANAKLPANNLTELVALAKGTAGQAVLRLGRTRYSASSRRRNVQNSGGCRHPTRALSWRGPGGERRCRRPH